MKWSVEWEKWCYLDNSPEPEIASISRCRDFTIEAVHLEDAIQIAEREAPRELERRKEAARRERELSGEASYEFVHGFHYVAHVIGLEDETGHYHMLHPARGVLHGQIFDMPDYGSLE